MWHIIWGQSSCWFLLRVTFPSQFLTHRNFGKSVKPRIPPSEAAFCMMTGWELLGLSVHACVSCMCVQDQASEISSLQKQTRYGTYCLVGRLSNRATHAQKLLWKIPDSFPLQTLSQRPEILARLCGVAVWGAWLRVLSYRRPDSLACKINPCRYEKLVCLASVSVAFFGFHADASSSILAHSTMSSNAVPYHSARVF